MTIREARRFHAGDMVRPKKTPVNMTITQVMESADGKSRYFTLDDGRTYVHRDVNAPAIAVINEPESKWPADIRKARAWHDARVAAGLARRPQKP